MQIRIALAEGLEHPRCPRCRATLQRQSGERAGPSGRLTAFLCMGCRRVVLIRLAEGRSEFAAESG